MSGIETASFLLERDLSMHVGTRLLAEPGPDEALIRVRWAGLCGSDLHVMRTGAWVRTWPATLGLLSIVASLQEATSGEVIVDGEPVEGPGRDRGVVFQTYTLFPWLTARENVEFALREETLNRVQRRALALEQLGLVGLESFADALLTKVWEQHRMTVLFVTHDVEEAIYISDRVVVMTNRPGRIKAEIRVDLPRPRSYDMISSPEFGALQGEVLEYIRSESVAAADLEGAIQ